MQRYEIVHEQTRTRIDGPFADRELARNAAHDYTRRTDVPALVVPVREGARNQQNLKEISDHLQAARSEWNNCKPGPESQALDRLIEAVKCLDAVVTDLEGASREG